ncbi:MAG: LPS-assembly protein LptD [bacterium]|nr:LPS-assembly protein LptD [bacterium]
MERANISLKHFTCLIALMLCGLLCAPASDAKIGDSLEVVEQEALTISAETLSYLADEHLFVAEGNVTIRYQEATLTADYVEFNEISGDALAVGNVLYEEGIETVTAEQGEFNLNNEQGTITMGSLALDDDQYMAGQEIIKTGEKTYTVKKGSFTACDSSWPTWQFRSSIAKIHEGQYLQAWNAVGYVKGIPVFYFPYFVYPIKTDRQSGFLIPEPGYSTTNGYSIGNTYFWAINRSQDATLRHKYYEKRGHKFDLEYRYFYSDRTDGRLEAQYVHEDKIDLQTKQRVKWNHQQGLPYDTKGRVNLDLTSDNQFDQDFDTIIDDRSNSKLTSNLSITKNLSQHTFKLLLDRVDDLRPENEDSNDRRIPELTFSSQLQQLFNSPLYIRQQTQAVYLIRAGKPEEEMEFARLDFSPSFSLPLNLLGGALTLTPGFDYHATFYNRDATTAADHDLDAEPVNRQHYSAEVAVDGPKFNRIFDLGTGRRTQKLKHLLEPSLSFNYEPAVDNNDVPKFDSIDQIGGNKPGRRMQYALTQRLLTKRVREEEWEKFQFDDEGDIFVDELETETKELTSLILSQFYDFEREEYQFSNINATLKIDPLDDYNLTLRTVYDVYVTDLTSMSIDFEGKLTRFIDFDLSWRRSSSVDRDEGTSEETSQFLDIETSFTLSYRFRLDYRGRINFKEGERIEDSLGLTYNGQCWNIYGNYTQQLIDDEVDKGFHIYLELKHIGKLLDISG